MFYTHPETIKAILNQIMTFNSNAGDQQDNNKTNKIMTPKLLNDQESNDQQYLVLLTILLPFLSQIVPIIIECCSSKEKSAQHQPSIAAHSQNSYPYQYYILCLVKSHIKQPKQWISFHYFFSILLGSAISTFLLKRHPEFNFYIHIGFCTSGSLAFSNLGPMLLVFLKIKGSEIESVILVMTNLLSNQCVAFALADAIRKNAWSSAKLMQIVATGCLGTGSYALLNFVMKWLAHGLKPRLNNCFTKCLSAEKSSYASMLSIIILFEICFFIRQPSINDELNPVEWLKSSTDLESLAMTLVGAPFITPDIIPENWDTIWKSMCNMYASVILHLAFILTLIVLLDKNHQNAYDYNPCLYETIFSTAFIVLSILEAACLHGVFRRILGPRTNDAPTGATPMAEHLLGSTGDLTFGGPHSEQP